MGDRHVSRAYTLAKATTLQMSKTQTPDLKVLSLELAVVAPGIFFETVSAP